MGYPAEISGADDDPVMQAIAAKFAQQATRPPTNIVPEQMRAAAQAAVLARNGNAKNTALNSQMQAMHADPAVMQMIMETYGPDMAAQYGGENGAVQQPQAIQQPVPSATQAPIPQTAQGIPQAPTQEIAEAYPPVDEGISAGQPPVAGAPTGMDPGLAAALGIVTGGAAGAGIGYAMNRQPRAPQMRGATADDFGMPQVTPPIAPPAAPPVKQVAPKAPVAAMPAPAAPPIDPKTQAAVMGEPMPPYEEDVRASNPMDDADAPLEQPKPVVEAPAPTKPRTSARNWGEQKTQDMNDSHMRSIIMEGRGGDTTPTPTEPLQANEAPAQAQEATPKRKRQPKKAADAVVGEGEAPKKRTRKASATPNADGGTDFVHGDAKAAKEAIKASKAKKAAPAEAAPESVASKVDAIAAETAAPVEAPAKKTRKPRTPKADGGKKTKAKAPEANVVEADTIPDAAPARLIKKGQSSRLDTPTGPGAKASSGMTLAEAREIIKPEPDWDVIERLKAGDMNSEEFNALKVQAKDMIRAAKGASTANPKTARREKNAEGVMKESKNQRTVYTYDGKDEAILKAMKEPVVQRRPMRKQDSNKSKLAEALARRKAK